MITWLKKSKEARQSSDRKVIKTWSRRSTVLPDFVGLTFAVHNGKKFIPVYVTENMVGHKMGEFSPSRVLSTAIRRRTRRPAKQQQRHQQQEHQQRRRQTSGGGSGQQLSLRRSK